MKHHMVFCVSTLKRKYHNEIPNSTNKHPPPSSVRPSDFLLSRSSPRSLTGCRFSHNWKLVDICVFLWELHDEWNGKKIISPPARTAERGGILASAHVIEQAMLTGGIYVRWILKWPTTFRLRYPPYLQKSPQQKCCLPKSGWPTPVYPEKGRWHLDPSSPLTLTAHVGIRTEPSWKRRNGPFWTYSCSSIVYLMFGERCVTRKFVVKS